MLFGYLHVPNRDFFDNQQNQNFERDFLKLKIFSFQVSNAHIFVVLFRLKAPSDLMILKCLVWRRLLSKMSKKSELIFPTSATFSRNRSHITNAYMRPASTTKRLDFWINSNLRFESRNAESCTLLDKLKPTEEIMSWPKTRMTPRKSHKEGKSIRFEVFTNCVTRNKVNSWRRQAILLWHTESWRTKSCWN